MKTKTNHLVCPSCRIHHLGRVQRVTLDSPEIVIFFKCPNKHCGEVTVRLKADAIHVMKKLPIYDPKFEDELIAKGLISPKTPK